MSQVHEKKAKKRKHAAAEIDAEDPAAQPSKKAKKDKSSKHKRKGKERADASEFRVLQASLRVTIPPVFANNLAAGVEEMLDSMVMRYVPALQGVLLAHDNLLFLESTATIKADCPYANCRVGFDATVWSPQVSMKLVGKVNLCSPDHIALLIHRTFNASIPRHHIPTDQWEFEYGPAENDPEFGAEGTAEGTAEGAEEGQGASLGGGGRWVHKVTGQKLGGEDGYVEFTVVGLTVANQMLSLLGSVQPDPFSPAHAPPRAAAEAASSSRSTEREAAEDIPDVIDDESEDEEDTFGMLGRMADEAEARQREQLAKEEEAAKKEKKRKRKEDKVAAALNDDAPSAEKKAKKKKKS